MGYTRNPITVQNIILEFGIKAWHEQITQFTVKNIGKQFLKLLRSTVIPFQMLQVIFLFQLFHFF